MKNFVKFCKQLHQDAELEYGYEPKQLIYGAGYSLGRKVVGEIILELQEAVESNLQSRLIKISDEHADISVISDEEPIISTKFVISTLRELEENWPMNWGEANRELALIGK